MNERVTETDHLAHATHAIRLERRRIVYFAAQSVKINCVLYALRSTLCALCSRTTTSLSHAIYHGRVCLSSSQPDEELPADLLA
ncbi:hypothetical protein TcWFU_010404 [Taenia crassiceps]|uniref:Uncharacterized protein n=1 Tax=Taenia crassiceps TaxID=6207 RepID=A0ABR4Q481_9CEST